MYIKSTKCGGNDMCKNTIVIKLLEMQALTKKVVKIKYVIRKKIEV